MDLREKVFKVKHRFAGHLARRMTSGMASTLNAFIAGDGKLFLKSFSNKQPDHRTVTQPILAGNEPPKTELVG